MATNIDTLIKEVNELYPNSTVRDYFPGTGPIVSLLLHGSPRMCDLAAEAFQGKSREVCILYTSNAHAAKYLLSKGEFAAYLHEPAAKLSETLPNEVVVDNLAQARSVKPPQVIMINPNLENHFEREVLRLVRE